MSDKTDPGHQCAGLAYHLDCCDCCDQGSESGFRIHCRVLAVGVFEDPVLDADATMEIAEKLDSHPDFNLYMYTGFGHAAFDTAPDYRERLLKFFTAR